MGRANAKPRSRAANGMIGPAAGHLDGSESVHSPGPPSAERPSGGLPTASQPWQRKEPPAICIPSKAARYCLLLGPLAVWVLAVAAGVYLCDVQRGAVVTAPRVKHPLLWFDRSIFRTIGSLLPLIFFLARQLPINRAYLMRAPGSRDPTTVTTASGTTGSSPKQATPPHVPCPKMAKLCMYVHVIVILVRAALYQTHLAVQGQFGLYMMSDHILLAASVLASQQLEMLFVSGDIRNARLSGRWRLGAYLALLLGLNVALCLCTSADMFYTARHYHHAAESVASLVGGLSLFQLPMAGLGYFFCTHQMLYRQ
ncbi:MAG: hypothetical protein WDW36_009220 [Sanguina aurantia]